LVAWRAVWRVVSRVDQWGLSGSRLAAGLVGAWVAVLAVSWVVQWAVSMERVWVAVLAVSWVVQWAA
jgi:hypothetical protein